MEFHHCIALEEEKQKLTTPPSKSEIESAPCPLSLGGKIMMAGKNFPSGLSSMHIAQHLGWTWFGCVINIQGGQGHSFLHLSCPVISECLNMVRMSDKPSGLIGNIRTDCVSVFSSLHLTALAPPCLQHSLIDILFTFRNMNCSGKSSLQREGFSKNKFKFYISRFSVHCRPLAA